MTPRDFARELAYPATRSTVLVALIAFFLLLEFAAFGEIFGLFLAFLVLPALMRYLMLLLEARARGRDPGPPGAELFLWVDNAWSLFPVVHVAVLVYAGWIFQGIVPAAVAWTVLLLLAAVVPASLAVLALARSPLESLKPRAVAGLIRRCGPAYWTAPAYLAAASGIVALSGELALAGFLRELLACYLLFAGFAVTGGVVRPFRLDREVMIPDPVEPDNTALGARLEQARTRTLNHAYGFISRGNRAGGLDYLYTELATDPEPRTAWPWYFERMLAWENIDAALRFGQLYLGRLLRDGERVTAVKLMLRCRLANEAFRPLEEDRLLALEAAEFCHNEELAGCLR